MKHLALAIALACALSGVSRAGEIHSTGAVAPPPPGTTTTSEAIPTTGEVSSTDGTSAQESTTLAIILALLGIVP